MSGAKWPRFFHAFSLCSSFDDRFFWFYSEICRISHSHYRKEEEPPPAAEMTLFIGIWKQAFSTEDRLKRRPQKIRQMALPNIWRQKWPGPYHKGEKGETKNQKDRHPQPTGALKAKSQKKRPIQYKIHKNIHGGKWIWRIKAWLLPRASPWGSDYQV